MPFGPTGGLSAVGGFMQGFANSYNAVHQKRLQEQLDQRHDLAQMYLGLAPNAKPEAQQEIFSRLAQIYSTPINKKLDKGLTDISSLQTPPGGQQGPGSPLAQLAAPQPQIATIGQAPVTPAPSGPPPSSPAAAPARTPGQQIATPLPPQPQSTVGPPPVTFGAPQGPAPLAATPPPPYHPFYTPEERAQLEANAAGMKAGADISAQTNARMAIVDKMRKEGASDSDIAFALGHQMPYYAFRSQVLQKGVAGADLLKSNPGITTIGGEAPDPKSRYDIVQRGMETFASPSGIASEKAEADIANAQARLPESQAKTAYYNARTGMIPYQTAKIVQDMQLNPQKVEMARANSVARWFGPTAPSRQSAQFAADVEDKIDAVTPLISSLAQQGKLGPIAGRWEDFLAGHIKSGDPDIANLRVQMDVLAKAVMKMHGFRNAEDAYRFIGQNLSVGSDPEQLMGSLEGLRTAARSYESMAQFPPEVQAQMMKSLTGGKGVTPKGAERIPPPPGSTDNTQKTIPLAAVEAYAKEAGITKAAAMKKYTDLGYTVH